MAERTRTFTGTLPDDPRREAWQEAHDAYCRDGINCMDHTNPYYGNVPVLVQVFEQSVVQTDVYAIQGIHVALKSGPAGDRFARWGRPAEMTEES